MNGRKVKMLRAKARDLTVGLPDRGLVDWQQINKLTHTHGTGALNNPHTTRGVYRELKRQDRSKPQ